MAAALLQVFPSVYTNYPENSLLISANTSEKYIVSNEYCIARHDDNMCFLPICRYHIILTGDIREWLQKRMHSVSTNKTWTVCIHILGTDSVVKVL